jgi:hypothetical protein
MILPWWVCGVLGREEHGDLSTLKVGTDGKKPVPMDLGPKMTGFCGTAISHSGICGFSGLGFGSCQVVGVK